MTDDSPSVAENAAGQYVVVARRYRPQTFEELIGQSHVAQALTGAIQSDRVGHAYLFTGARGVGKTSAARILAKALNCVEGPTPVPCNQCEICLSVSSGGDVDVLEIDGASNRGIDEIRQLRQNVAVRPSRARFKIYIIDEVHMLTKEAFNALLKTLEEPPEHVKFIFATTEPNKIPVTILSRCQRFDFAGIETDAIHERLRQIADAEGVAAESEALQLLAMRAGGSMRDSQSLLEQLLSTGKQQLTVVDVTELLGIAPAARLSRLVGPIAGRDPAAALAELDGAIHDGAEPGQLIDQLLGYFRDVMTQAAGCERSQLMYVLPGQHEEVAQLAEQLGLNSILAMVQILDQAAARLRVSTQARTLAEMAVVRMTQLGALDELADLIAALKSGEPPAATQSPAPQQRPAATPAPQRSPAARTTATKPAAQGDVASASAVAQPTPDVPAAAIDPEKVGQLWKEAVGQLTGMLAGHAAAANKISLDEQGRVVASFPGSFSLSREACERPDARQRIEAALTATCGGRATVVFTAHETPDPQQGQAKGLSRREKQASAASQPFVRKAMELFDVDESRLRYIPPDAAS